MNVMCRWLLGASARKALDPSCCAARDIMGVAHVFASNSGTEALYGFPWPNATCGDGTREDIAKTDNKWESSVKICLLMVMLGLNM